MAFNEQLDSSFRQKADMSMVFNRQIDRKNLAGSFDYPHSIEVMLNNLPVRWQKWVRAQTDKYTTTVEVLRFKQFSGVKAGSTENPMVWNDEHTDLGHSTDPGFSVKRLEDGSIDWEDPNIYSPYLDTKTEIDYELKDSIVSEAAENAKLTWTIDPLEQDAGDTEEYIIERKKTPVKLPPHMRAKLKKILEWEKEHDEIQEKET